MSMITVHTNGYVSLLFNAIKDIFNCFRCCHLYSVIKCYYSVKTIINRTSGWAALSNILDISWQDKVPFRNADARFVINQHVKLDFVILAH